MTDLEAQLDTNVRGSTRQSVEVPLQKLAEFVEILTQLLQSNTASEELAGPSSDPQGAISGVPGADSYRRNEITATAADETISKEKEEFIVKFTPEEIAHWNEALLEEFDSFDVPQDLIKADPWVALQHLNWLLYASYYQRYAETQPDMMNKPHCIPDIIRHFSNDPKDRLEYQKKILLGLSRWWWNNGADPSSPNRGILDMGPFVSLIAMRLPRSWRVGDHNMAITLTRLQILTVLLDTPRILIDSGKALSNDERLVWENELSFGMILDQCYQRGILEQPGDQDVQGYKLHVAELNQAIHYVNLWENFNRRDLFDITSVRAIRSMTLAESWLRYQNKRSVANSLMDYEEDDLEDLGAVDKLEENRFKCKDLNLEMLRKTGKVRFTWTEFIDEHLDVDDGIDIITIPIFWFGFAAKASPLFGVGCQTRSETRGFGVIDELLATYSLLFRSSNDTYEENLAEYGLLPIPQWLRVFHGTEKGTLGSQQAKDMSYFLQPDQPRVSDIECHIASLDQKLPATQSFNQFPKFGKRLMATKAFLDYEKSASKGIQNLWTGRIRRWWAETDFDAGAEWCTFWAIVVIGGILIILACLEVVATYQGLNRGSRFREYLFSQ